MNDPERLSVSRTVSAPPSTVFAFLADPSNHHRTEPTDWVRDAIEPTPITGPGQVFPMNMYIEQAGGHYVIHNLVTVFQPNRAIGWLPTTVNDDGVLEAGGWWWRYDLAEDGDGTRVTLTYDWTDTPSFVRDQIGGMPAVPTEFLERSLASLDAAIVEDREGLPA
ncbi:ATPase [Rhodococcoides kyotonense]|uniref:ATPase n=1 Tax=Rhodococcoides kyotonense TaxID=398843 RepID=A0A177YBJ6_9NOCA|nr:ATPase [Rhodococcus kyotonensis]